MSDMKAYLYYSVCCEPRLGFQTTGRTCMHALYLYLKVAIPFAVSHACVFRQLGGPVCMRYTFT